ncbi:hypothetical protein [Caulobacter mirabilis]|uniref:Prepilin-type cleavage/methylation domain-containing protein n=1 Tax=Caulobacter mirabilis TaxID=69666 RepID=A0A2D2AZI7_9CAUL|nr:hypothetical protein [Caulobacter mirabilis]ATQ43429.1 hypothetical protein CSW64_13905 [Caulobacter mirabilis]
MPRSNEDGYTLAEALAALLIIGLAVGGLVEGARLIGRMQAPTVGAVRETRDLRQAEAAVAALLARRPGNDRTLRGDPKGFTFDCGGVCSLEVRDEAGGTTLLVRNQTATRRYALPAGPGANLLYDTRNGRYDRWPLETQDVSLRGVALVAPTAEGEVALLAAHSWIEHPKTCAFDMVSKTCRTTAQ